MSPTVDLDTETYDILTALGGGDTRVQAETIRSALTLWQVTSHGVQRVAQEVLATPTHGQTYVQAVAESARRSAALSSESLGALAGLIGTMQTGAADIHTDPVRDVFGSLLMWATEDKQRRELTVSVTTLQPRGSGEPLIATAWGNITSDGPHSFYGTLEQRFADRLTATGAAFDPARADRLGFLLALPAAERGAVILSLDSWGGAKHTLSELHPASTGLIGFGPGIAGRNEAAVHFISLGKFDIPG